MNKPCFYFDESVQLAVSQQLTAHGIDAVSAHSLGQLGDTDTNHLERAAQMQHVLCTSDTDFIVLARTVLDHAGIVYGAQNKVNIGQWVKDVRTLHAQYEQSAIAGKLVFLPLK